MYLWRFQLLVEKIVFFFRRKRKRIGFYVLPVLHFHVHYTTSLQCIDDDLFKFRSLPYLLTQDIPFGNSHDAYPLGPLPLLELLSHVKG
jgi:hypothetical protein